MSLKIAVSLGSLQASKDMNV
uniref:Uncharacterized protein n=1 Tax=Arundo donax TaxID=35708 RepID=A0A0A9FM32_ARUDO